MILPRHLCVDISAHGLGHVAQATAVLNALDCNHTRLTIRSTAPIETLKERIHHPFNLVHYKQDNGMIMYDALRVNTDETFGWYNDFHSDYEKRVLAAAKELEALQPDLLFSNIPYLSLEAASLVGIESIAMCSLNWADIFKAYCGDNPCSQNIYSQIHEAYSKASMFLQPTPAMPMMSLQNTREISPIAIVGDPAPQVMRALTARGSQTRFVLVGVGGLTLENFPLGRWPTIDNTCWIFPDVLLQQHGEMGRPDFFRQSLFKSMSYIDLLASSDLVITKTGYGTQTECVVNQVPAICINRLDWPEHPFLRDWHCRHGEVVFVDYKDIGTHIFQDLVLRMLDKASHWTKERVLPNGAKEAADILHHRLFS